MKSPEDLKALLHARDAESERKASQAKTANDEGAIRRAVNFEFLRDVVTPILGEYCATLTGEGHSANVTPLGGPGTSLTRASLEVTLAARPNRRRARPSTIYFSCGSHGDVTCEWRIVSTSDIDQGNAAGGKDPKEAWVRERVHAFAASVIAKT